VVRANRFGPGTRLSGKAEVLPNSSAEGVETSRSASTSLTNASKRALLILIDVTIMDVAKGVFDV
jgi:hypothetical protein